MPNHPTITTLVDLARADLAIVHGKKKIRTLNEKSKNLAEKVQNAENNLSLSKAKLSKLHQDEATTQQRLESYRKRKNTAVIALERGLGDPNSAERQIDQCGQIIDDLEIAIIENLERQEAMVHQIDNAQKAVSNAQHIADAFEAEKAIEANAVTEIIHAKTHLRQSIIQTLDVTIRTRYEQLRKSKGTAVARVVDDCCRTCQMALPMQDSSDLRRGREIQCRKCGRWLFIAED